MVDQLATDFNNYDIIYNNNLSQSNSTFFFRYAIYEDVCNTSDAVRDTPVVFYSSNSPSRSSCHLEINLSDSNWAFLTAIEMSKAEDTCSYNDVRLQSNRGHLLCQGRGCLNPDGFEISEVDVASVNLKPSPDCRFYWKLTGKQFSHDLTCIFTDNS